MNALTRSLVTMKPLIQPTPAPIAIPAATPKTMFVSSITCAATQPENATTEPTDKSNPPQMIT